MHFSGKCVAMVSFGDEIVFLWKSSTLEKDLSESGGEPAINARTPDGIGLPSNFFTLVNLIKMPKMRDNSV